MSENTSVPSASVPPAGAVAVLGSRVSSLERGQEQATHNASRLESKIDNLARAVDTLQTTMSTWTDEHGWVSRLHKDIQSVSEKVDSARESADAHAKQTDQELLGLQNRVHNLEAQSKEVEKERKTLKYIGIVLASLATLLGGEKGVELYRSIATDANTVVEVVQPLPARDGATNDAP